MSNLGLKAELRDGETIRAYLDELALLKTPVQLWIPQSDALPFETTIERISGNAFVTTTTPLLPEGQQLFVSFLLDARRFNANTQVISTGVFRIPTSITQGERRERLRATFTQAEEIQVFAIERLVGTFVTGRLLLGTLLDLSIQGLRLAVEELSALEGHPAELQRGDTFDVIRIQGLPFTPDIHCRAVLAHLTHAKEGDSAGFLLVGLEAGDQKNIERILARRFPTTFGQAFPKKKRKTDLGDRLGAPVQVPIAAKASEVVAAPAPRPPTVKEKPARPASSPAMRLRKAGRKILILSASLEGGAVLAEQMREDDFRQVKVASSFLEAKQLATATRFDLLLLDLKVGGHFGQMILQSLRKHGLLLDTPIILVADRRDASIPDVVEEIQAIHVHDRRDSYDELVPVLYGLLV